MLCSGPRAVAAVQAVADKLGNAVVASTAVVSDDIPAIQQILKRWADEDQIQLIITTGMLPLFAILCCWHTACGVLLAHRVWGAAGTFVWNGVLLTHRMCFP